MKPRTKAVGRLDHWLRQRYPHLTRFHRDEALRTGLVTGPKGERLTKGTKLSVDFTPNTEPLERHLGRLAEGDPTLELTVLYETDEWVIVDKPPGLPGHPLSLLETQTVTHWAFAHYAGLATKFPEAQPTLTPHRLDTGTSGLLIVARSTEAYERWRRYFQRKQVTKVYHAWCWGVPDWTEKKIERPMGHLKGDDRRMTVRSQDWRKGSRELAAVSIAAVTEVHPDAGRSLIRVECHTGVMHQVRVHLASVGLPLIGDVLYDVNYAERPFRPSHHFLRATELHTPEGRFTAPRSSPFFLIP